MEITWPAPNAYWGRRSGTDHPSKGLVFLIKRGSTKRTGEHSSLCGYKLKKNRNYKNAKLIRKAYWANVAHRKQEAWMAKKAKQNKQVA